MAHFSKKLISLTASMGILSLTPIAFAQETVDPLEGLGPSEENVGGLFGDSGSVFDLVHRAVLANPVSASEYQQRQHRNVNDAAAEFRQQRQEALNESGAVYSVPVYSVPVVSDQSDSQ